MISKWTKKKRDKNFHKLTSVNPSYLKNKPDLSKCQYYETDLDDPNFIQCEEPLHEGRETNVYCKYHYHICYKPITKKRKYYESRT